MLILHSINNILNLRRNLYHPSPELTHHCRDPEALLIHGVEELSHLGLGEGVLTAALWTEREREREGERWDSV